MGYIKDEILTLFTAKYANTFPPTKIMNALSCRSFLVVMLVLLFSELCSTSEAVYHLCEPVQVERIQEEVEDDIHHR